VVDARLKLRSLTFTSCSSDNSVGMATGLRAEQSEDRFPVGTKSSLLQHDQTAFGAPSASHSMDTGVLTGSKAAGA
jgi:hypothetical protein